MGNPSLILKHFFYFFAFHQSSAATNESYVRSSPYRALLAPAVDQTPAHTLSKLLSAATPKVEKT